jgi:hypothetical protein
MLRKMGIQFDGAIYQLMSRGDRREKAGLEEEKSLAPLHRRAKGYELNSTKNLHAK